MANKPSQSENRSRVEKRITELNSQLLIQNHYVTAWENLLTDEERERLGGDLKQCWRKTPNLVALWIELRGKSQVRTILDLAHDLRDVGRGGERSDLLGQHREQDRLDCIVNLVRFGKKHIRFATAGAPPLPTPPGANGPWTPLINGFQRPSAFGGVKGQSPLLSIQGKKSKRLFRHESSARPPEPVKGICANGPPVK